jgi:hypothetical protein
MKDELSRASTWVFALAVGLFVPGIRIMGDIGRGAEMPWEWYVTLAVVSWSGTLGASHGGPFVLRLVLAAALYVVERWPRYEPEVVPVTTTPAPAPAPRPVAYNVNGQARTLELVDNRSERQTAWNDAAWRVVEWYEQTRSLAANALVPAAISDRTAWVRLTDELAAGFVTKDKTGTRWAWPLGRVKATLALNRAEWPDSEPPRVAACPTAAARAVVDAE